MFTIAFPVGAVLAAILVLVPSPAHWRARNVAAISLITWIFLMNVIYTINSLGWSSNSLPQFLIWCDISTCFFPPVLAKGHAWVWQLKTLTRRSVSIHFCLYALPFLYTALEL